MNLLEVLIAGLMTLGSAIGSMQIWAASASGLVATAARGTALEQTENDRVVLQAQWISSSGTGLPFCLDQDEPLSEGLLSDNDLVVVHNLPAQLRVSANGLVIDGGTVVISAPGTELRRCVVVALPLGIVRMGRYSGEAKPPVSSTSCAADPTL